MTTDLTYDAIVSYHNTLVQIRFAVASLFIAAVAFLVAALVGDMKWHGHSVLLPIVGMVITGVAWIIELRTTQLLDNLAALGREMEDAGLVKGKGFFHLMVGPQPIGVRWPLRTYKAPPQNQNRTVRRLISHSFALNTVYLVFAIFWANAIYIDVTHVALSVQAQDTTCSHK